MQTSFPFRTFLNKYLVTLIDMEPKNIVFLNFWKKVFEKIDSS